MDHDFYENVPEWIIFAALLLVLFAAETFGWRLGRTSSSEADEAARAQVGSLQAAVLGLLALLLGFTFSMAADRFDARRELIVHEANAIGTSLLRATLVAQPERDALKGLLERYVDVRVRFYEAGGDSAKTQATLDESERIHAELWRLVTIAAAREPTPVTALLVSEVNLLIDLHAVRLAALSNHVPAIVMWMLLLVGVLSAGITGYASGFSNKHYRLPAAVVLLLIASVSLTIVDLERPRRGLIRSGQAAMLDLQRSTNRGAAASQP